MNQNDQMRATVDRLLGEIICLECAVLYKDPWPELERRVRDMKKIAEQALNHTPDTGKMVRLTDEEIETHFERECWVSVTFADGAKGIALDKVTARDFANAIMDAMIKKNGG